MSKRYIIYSIILLILCSAVLLKGSQNVSAESITIPTVQFLKYENPTYEYIIQYPSDWIKDDTSKDHVSFESPDLHPNSDSYYNPHLSVNVIDTKGRSLQSIAEDEISRAEVDVKNFKVIQDIPFGLQGNPANQLIYSYKDSDYGKLKEMKILMAKGDKYYDIDFTAEANEYEKYLPTLQTMVNSFEIDGMQTQEPNQAKGNDILCKGSEVGGLLTLVPHPATMIAGAVSSLIHIFGCK